MNKQLGMTKLEVDDLQSKVNQGRESSGKELRRLQSRLEEVQKERDESQYCMQRLSSTNNGWDVEQERLTSQIKNQAETLKATESRLFALMGEKAELEASHDKAKKDLENAKARLAEVQGRLEESKSTISGNKEAETKLSEELESLNKDYERLEGELEQALKTSEALLSANKEVEGRLAKEAQLRQKEVAELEAEIETIEESLEKMERQYLGKFSLACFVL